MSARTVGRLAVVVCAALGSALGAIGCLSDDTSLNPAQNGFDASFPDAGPPVFDASGSVDANGNPLPDAAPDAPFDAAADAAPPPDAGNDASGVSQFGLVAGGAIGHSTRYVLKGSTGPASAPVLQSPHYKLVGGMTVSTQTP